MYAYSKRVIQTKNEHINMNLSQPLYDQLNKSVNRKMIATTTVTSLLHVDSPVERLLDKFQAVINAQHCTSNPKIQEGNDENKVKTIKETNTKLIKQKQTSANSSDNLNQHTVQPTLLTLQSNPTVSAAFAWQIKSQSEWCIDLNNQLDCVRISNDEARLLLLVQVSIW